MNVRAYFKFLHISSLCSMVNIARFRLFPFVLDMTLLVSHPMHHFVMIKNRSNEARMRIDNFPNVRISGIRISGRVLYYALFYTNIYSSLSLNIHKIFWSRALDYSSSILKYQRYNYGRKSKDYTQISDDVSPHLQHSKSGV